MSGHTTFIKKCFDEKELYRRENEKLRKGNEILRKMGEFYGGPESWNKCYESGGDGEIGQHYYVEIIESDTDSKTKFSLTNTVGGKRARQALKEYAELMGDLK